MRLVVRLVSLAILVAGSMVLGTVVYMYAYEEPVTLPAAQAIVVLSGPGAMDPVPMGETRTRVERGVALWEAGLAPRVVMSGAGATVEESGNPDSRGMAALARGSGVPDDAIVEEANSHSTLQNAWFTADLPGIDPTAPILVVTHRYHLPRAWASFRWAGFEQITLVAADGGSPQITTDVLAEGIKWPINLVRATAASIALRSGSPEKRVASWLE